MNKYNNIFNISIEDNDTNVDTYETDSVIDLVQQDDEDVNECINDLEEKAEIISTACEAVCGLTKQIYKNEEIIFKRPTKVTINDIVASQEALAYAMGRVGVYGYNYEPFNISIESVMIGKSLIVSTENIKDFIKTVWEKIKAFFKYVFNAIANFFKKLKELVFGTKKQHKKTEKEINEMSESDFQEAQEEVKKLQTLNEQIKVYNDSEDGADFLWKNHDPRMQKSIDNLMYKYGQEEMLQIVTIGYEKLYDMNQSLSDIINTSENIVIGKQYNFRKMVSRTLKEGILITKKDIQDLQTPVDKTISEYLKLDPKNVYVFLSRYVPNGEFLAIYWDSNDDQFKTDTFPTAHLTEQFRQMLNKQKGNEKPIYNNKREAIKADKNVSDSIEHCDQMKKDIEDMSQDAQKTMEAKIKNLGESGIDNAKIIDETTRMTKAINTAVTQIPIYHYKAEKSLYNMVHRHIVSIINKYHDKKNN